MPLTGLSHILPSLVPTNQHSDSIKHCNLSKPLSGLVVQPIRFSEFSESAERLIGHDVTAKAVGFTWW